MLRAVLAALSGALPWSADAQLRFDPAQAEAVLSIVEKRSAGELIIESDWKRLFSSEGHRRLKAREESLNRSLPDSVFREFVLSASLARRAEDLRRTLATWGTRDLDASADRVRHYLPTEARIRAAVYPVIKPQTNSFVYDVRGDPAIFLYLDPDQAAASFENTVAHELHHIGLASVAAGSDSARAALSERARLATDWMGAFGEGIAMLAAAGGPDVHPHASSPVEDRQRWDRDQGNFAADLHTLDSFFLDVIDGRLASEEAVRSRALSFFGVQGPWYTVGYRMAVIVEERFGREALMECILDPRLLLARYNAAVRGRSPVALPSWSPRLIREIGMR